MTITKLYSIQTIAEALRRSDVKGPTRERIFDRLEHFPSYTINETVTEQDRETINRFSESDIRAGISKVLNGLKMDEEVFYDELVPKLVDAITEQRYTRPMKARELQVDQHLNHRIRFPRATISKWQFLTDFAFRADGVYLVLDGSLAVVDPDCPIELDTREVVPSA